MVVLCTTALAKTRVTTRNGAIQVPVNTTIIQMSLKIKFFISLVTVLLLCNLTAEFDMHNYYKKKTLYHIMIDLHILN